jgi:putative ABC transport system substrate-binding protein
MSGIDVTVVPELARRGFVEGRNLVIVRRSSGADLDRLGGLARDLVAQKLDAIIAVGLPAVRAAMAAGPEVPIVASFVDDPVTDGLAANFIRPGGKVTGIAMLSREGEAKRLELLHEAIPGAHRFAYLVTPDVTRTAAIKRAAAAMGLEIMEFPARTAAEYQATFDAMRDAQVDGVVIAASPVFAGNAAQIAALAAEPRLPTICEWRYMAGSGCLIGYGPNLRELRVRTADFVVRLFAGGNPAEMPFEQPTHFEMAINNKIAAAIGVELPFALIARADEVIE